MGRPSEKTPCIKLTILNTRKSTSGIWEPFLSTHSAVLQNQKIKFFLFKYRLVAYQLDLFKVVKFSCSDCDLLIIWRKIITRLISNYNYNANICGYKKRRHFCQSDLGPSSNGYLKMELETTVWSSLY